MRCLNEGLKQGACLHKPSIFKDAHLIFDKGLDQIACDGATIFKSGLMPHPLPDLRSRNLRRSRIFHEIIQRHRPASPQPGFDILNPDPDIFA